MLIEAQLPLVITSFFCTYVFEQAQTYTQKKALYLQGFYCRGGRIRTCDLLVPNEAR